MISLEPPSLAVFVRVQAMLDTNVAAQHQSSTSTIQAYYIVLVDRLSN
jgi:hypothetical protein